MKRLAAACSTFLIGISAATFFHDGKQDVGPETITVAEVPASRNAEVLIEPKTAKSAPFFSSFGKDDYYGGWLIPDEFPGMKEVWTIKLDRDEKDGKGLVWSAMVLTSNADGTANDDDIFESMSIITDSDHLSFSTNKIRGIQYKFDGKFFKQGKDFSDDEKVLTGTMQKIVRGKMVAKFTADFAYNEPVCFH